MNTQSHTLLLACAGLSTRFGGHAPKWTLTHPHGNLMAVHAIQNIVGYTRVVVLMRQSHTEQFSPQVVQKAFLHAGHVVEVHVVPETNSASETVAHYLCNHPERMGERFTVKDCDNSFRLDINKSYYPSNDPADAYVAVYDLMRCKCTTPGNRSYVTFNDRGDVHNIIERPTHPTKFFCCGAYGWRSGSLFLDALGAWKDWNGKDTNPTLGEVMSQTASFKNQTVEAVGVEHYEDWGTLEDWQRFCADYRTLFVDIDGVLFKSAHRHFSPTWGNNLPIEENINALNRLYSEGKTHIILTTSRDSSAYDSTVEQLEKHGVLYHRLIMGLPVCRRVVINDVLTARGDRPTAVAINIERNSATLNALLVNS